MSEDRIVAITPAGPGWVVRYADDAEPGRYLVEPVAVWALMQDDGGRTWVAGIDVIGHGALGRPCDGAGNFYDYQFQPDGPLSLAGTEGADPAPLMPPVGRPE